MRKNSDFGAVPKRFRFSFSVLLLLLSSKLHNRLLINRIAPINLRCMQNHVFHHCFVGQILTWQKLVDPGTVVGQTFAHVAKRICIHAYCRIYLEIDYPKQQVEHEKNQYFRYLNSPQTILKESEEIPTKQAISKIWQNGNIPRYWAISMTFRDASDKTVGKKLYICIHFFLNSK